MQDGAWCGPVCAVPEVFALQSMFEGLFVRSLKPTGRFKEALKELGYDLDRQKTKYPLEVWNTSVDLAAAELYPGLSLPQAWEKLGRQFIEGYFQTLVGKMIGATLPFLNAKVFIGRMPRFMTTGLENAKVTLEWTGDRQAVLTLREVAPHSSSLMAGVAAVCFERMKVAPVKLETKPLGGIDTQLIITLP